MESVYYNLSLQRDPLLYIIVPVYAYFQIT